MYSISFTNRFKKDFLRCKKRNYDIAKIEEIFRQLASSRSVPEMNKPHKLSGEYSDCLECHIENDWLVIWQNLPNNEIRIIRTGTHSDLF